MARTYFFFLLFAGFLSAMVSGGPGGSGSSSSSPRDASASRYDRYEERASESEDVPAGAIALEREADGHFYAHVDINGMPIRVLVDTGATGIALSRDDARRAGLAVSAGMHEIVGRGASGDVRGEYVTLDKVALGSTSATSVPAVVLDGGDQSLLGQSFLREFDSVEIQGDRMLLR